MSVTNKHIFDEITKLRLEVKDDMKVIRDDVDDNTNWRNQITGKLTVVFVIIGIIVNFTMDWFRDKFST